MAFAAKSDLGRYGPRNLSALLRTNLALDDDHQPAHRTRCVDREIAQPPDQRHGDLDEAAVAFRCSHQQLVALR